MEKPVSEFGVNRQHWKGKLYLVRRCYCRPCASAVTTAWQQKRCAEDPEYAAYRQEYHKRHSYTYYRKIMDPLRAEMFTVLGDRCSCCGESHPTFLTLEHVGRWGKQHRQALGTKNSLYYVIKDAKRMGWPKDKFDILCHNCNQATRFGDPCPHQGPANLGGNGYAQAALPAPGVPGAEQ